MKISVFGLGYVGCVTAARLAAAGHEVIGVDVNADKVDMINRGASPIVEEGLGDLLAQVVESGQLRATHDATEAVSASELALICVGTPSKANGGLDLRYLERVVGQIGEALSRKPKRFKLVVRSTVLPRSTEKVVWPALRMAADDEVLDGVEVAVNPEFIREGSALADFLDPPFTLVGSDSPAVVDQLRELYSSVKAPFVKTDVRTAEMVKYVCNAFHALKVCFANEVAGLCDALGADAVDVLRIFRMDRRLNISEAYLKPGFAFGGSCLPKDVRALAHAAGRADVEAPLLTSIMTSNDAQVQRAIDLVRATGRRNVGIVGLAFKPGTDDLRESPLVRLVETLLGKGMSLRVLDRNVSLARLVGANRRYIEGEIPHIASILCDTVEELLAHSEVIVIGNGGEDAVRVLCDAPPGVVVVDLTRSLKAALPEVVPRRAESVKQDHAAGRDTIGSGIEAGTAPRRFARSLSVRPEAQQ